jgi:restriction system protein
MAVWMIRAGGRGERQDFALEKQLAVIGWDSIPDLSQFSTRESLDAEYRRSHPQAKPSQIATWVGQLWAFAKRVSIGDVIVLPLKGQDAVALGEATGPYKYEPNNPVGAKHTRPVKWVASDTPRSRFDKDLLFSFGSLLTVCQIKRNDAESRIRAIMLGKVTLPVKPVVDDEIDGTADTIAASDLGEYAATQISGFIGQKFTGHELADLVAAVLQAQGYQTQISEPGPDGGVDIIAGRVQWVSTRLGYASKSNQGMDNRTYG